MTSPLRRILGSIPLLLLAAMAPHAVNCRADGPADVVELVGAWPGFSRGFAEGIAVTNGHAYVADWSAGLQIVDVRNPAQPRWVGQYDTPGEARSVVVGGEYAYIADGSKGLVVVNVSLPSRPRPVAEFQTGGDARGIYLEGSRLYVADREIGLIVFNIENPEQPQRVGVYLKSGARGVVMVDQYAYLTLWPGGLEILDMSQPANPVFVARLDLTEREGPGEGRGIARMGQWVLVAARQGGLWVLNASDPKRPAVTSKRPTGGAAEFIVPHGTRAYVATSFAGVQVFDVADPSAPSRLGAYSNGTDVEALAISGDFIFVASEFGGFYVLDANDVSQLKQVGAQIPYGASQAVAAHEGVAYVADGVAGLQVIDISDVHEPKLLGRLPSEQPVNCVDVGRIGHRLVLLDQFQGLNIVDVSDPAFPRLESRVVASGGVPPLVIAGSTAIMLEGSIPGHRVLHWVDLANPSTPSLKGDYLVPYQVAAMTANSRFVVLALSPFGAPFGAESPCPSQCIQVLDWSDMMHPRLVESYDVTSGAWSLAANEKWLLLGTLRGKLQLFEFTENGRLQERASIQVDEGNDAIVSLSIDGDLAWAQHGKRFSAFDLSHPGAPKLLGQSKLELNGRLTAHGDLALVAAGTSGVSILRLDPMHPRKLGQYLTAGSVRDVAVIENRAYVATSTGVEELDATDPARMRLVSRSDLGPASHVSVNPSFIYASTGADVARGGVLVAGVPFAGAITIDIPGLRDVYAHEDLLLVADDRFGLQILSGVARGRLSRLGTYISEHEGRAVVAAGNFAYLADADAGLQVIDISDPRQPKRVGTYNTPDRARGVAVAGTYVYVADDEEGLHILDVANPREPKRLGSFHTRGEAIGVAVEGTYAYVACGQDGLEVIDVANPFSPRLAGRHFEHPALAVAVSQGRVFLAGGIDGLITFESYRPEIRFSRAALKQDGLQLSVRFHPDRAVRLERSENLRDWEEVRRMPRKGDSAVVLDPGADLSSRRFYRMREEP